VTDNNDLRVKFSTKQPISKRFGSFIIVYNRAKVLYDEFRKEEKRIARLQRVGKLPPQLALPDAAKMWALFSLWLACLYVVIEGWERSHRYGSEELLTDASVNQLLTSEHRDRLELYRNTVFHPELHDHSDANEIAIHYGEIRPWAESLTQELGRAIRTKVWPGSDGDA
jgi:hypothetical protein